MSRRKKKERCLRCGRCCHFKTFWDGLLVFTNRTCRYFDPQTRRCTVYKKRFRMGVGCLTVAESIERRALPTDCPYVEDIEGYEGPLTMEEATKIIAERKAASSKEKQKGEER